MMIYNIFGFVFILNMLQVTTPNIDVTFASISSLVSTEEVTLPSTVDPLVVKSFEKESFAPDLVPVPPGEFYRVRYGSDVEVNLGNELTPTQVKDEPTLNRWDAKNDSLYTLCMIDPDAPSVEKPIFSQWLHWLVGNIPGHNIAKGEVMAEYVGAMPEKGTGLHRYVFLVYKQPKKLTFPHMVLSNRTGRYRNNFRIWNFAIEYNLGELVAGNYFYAQYDDYVPKLYKQLGRGT